MKYAKIREEELKNKVAHDYFTAFDCTRIIGDIDFCVVPKIATTKSAAVVKSPIETTSLLWAEAKKDKTDIYAALTQLILTIGKARTFDQHLPPAYLGAFDGEKIAFIPYNDIHGIFNQNDFNWKITPSNRKTREFKTILAKVTQIIKSASLLFNFITDDDELNEFIENNFVATPRDLTKIQIDKNNFMIIYDKWLKSVKPTIIVPSWDNAKKSGIIDGDFYLADLLAYENKTLKEKLFIVLEKDHYELDRKFNDLGMLVPTMVRFNDGQRAHTQFWNRYERPPHVEYWDYIVERRDLLVPQDVRERKGSFFTPQIWVELSQKYLAAVLGENWQDEYYVWDCAAGTGNLLAGLTNKYNVWASTLDKQDVEVMKDRIKNGANMLECHVFQFDFLNDDFAKLPEPLRAIIDDEEKRKKLVIYINPPYAEATTAKTVTKTGKNKAKTAIDNKIYTQYKTKIGKASNELFAHFLTRIYCEIPKCKIANFSKLKILQSPNFANFREIFRAKLAGAFLVPANTFDNVTGEFPIGFFIWDTAHSEKFSKISADVYDRHGRYWKRKKFYGNLPKSINRWIKQFADQENVGIGYMGNPAPDFQNNKFLNITNRIGTRHVNYYAFTATNIFTGAIYFAVRQVFTATWLNDRDQFLTPNKRWQTDDEFKTDCLALLLFHGQNRISYRDGVNHWLPFTEREVNAAENFASNFMTQFIAGKITVRNNGLITENLCHSALKFSAVAQAVFAAGKKLWQYYHAQPSVEVNAALYDIRAYFQGRGNHGKMNSHSDDEKYMTLIGDLRDKLKILAQKIEPKVYEYGFLKK